MEYSKEQLKFIEADAPRLLLEAPAGSGKTETVAERVRRKVLAGKKVGLFCFTHSSRKTLQNRLDKAGIDLEVRTVVSYAHEVVSKAFGKLDVGDGLEIAQMVSRKGASAKAILNFESLTANGAPYPKSVPATISEAFAEYVEQKNRYKYLSFTDVLLAAVGLCSDEYDEMIIDEAQDLSPIQHAFVQSISSKSFVYVGDSQQAIYGFSGVDPYLFSKLRMDGWELVELSETYRVPSVVAAAVSKPRGAVLRAVRPGGSVRALEAPYKGVQAMLSPLLEPGDAVLAPTARQLNRIASYVETELDNKVSRHDIEGYMTKGSIYFSTIHAAKGGEWKRVYILDVNEYGLWSPMEKTNPSDPDDLRRLFYVACSRALEEVIFVNIGEDLPYGLGGVVNG